MNPKDVYPPHFTYPDNRDIYFLPYIPTWKALIDQLATDEPRVAIEVGSLHGACSVWLLENYLNRPALDKLYYIDITESSFLKTNMEPYPHAEFLHDKSFNALLSLNTRFTSPIANLIYIDAFHHSKNVMEDAVLAWNLLKVGGVLIFDDYTWGPTNSPDEKPQTAIDAFLSAYWNHYNLLGKGSQVYLQKTK
jgi:predicted O-methyltransferase YrrM